MSRPYTRESIAHALAHHESRGALRSVSPPELNGRSTWRITLAQAPLDPEDFTPKQAYALCLGLAQGEALARVEYERFVHDLAAYAAPGNDPPCLAVTADEYEQS